MAVKLYEKDPSKLTTLEDRVPLNTGDNIVPEVPLSAAMDLKVYFGAVILKRDTSTLTLPGLGSIQRVVLVVGLNLRKLFIRNHKCLKPLKWRKPCPLY